MSIDVWLDAGTALFHNVGKRQRQAELSEPTALTPYHFDSNYQQPAQSWSNNTAIGPWYAVRLFPIGHMVTPAAATGRAQRRSSGASWLARRATLSDCSSRRLTMSIYAAIGLLANERRPAAGQRETTRCGRQTACPTTGDERPLNT